MSTVTTTSQPSSITAALALHSQGAMPQAELVQWCLTNIFDMQQATALLAVVDGMTFCRIMQAQQDLVREEERLKAKRAVAGALVVKISKKGAISLYGLSARFPSTFYASQWERIFSVKEEIEKACQGTMSATYNLAEYLFEETKKGFKLAGQSDLEFAKSLPSLPSHVATLPEGSTLDLAALIAKYIQEAKSLGDNDAAVAEVAKKAALTKFNVTAARKEAAHVTY